MIDPNKTENLWMRFAPPSASGDFQKRYASASCLVSGPKKTERDMMSSSAPFLNAVIAATSLPKQVRLVPCATVLSVRL